VHKKYIQNRVLSSDFSRKKFEGPAATYITNKYFFLKNYCSWESDVCNDVSVLHNLMFVHTIIIHCSKVAPDVV